MRRDPQISISPNPAVAGQPVLISVPGPGPWYISVDPDGDVHEYNPTNGEIEISTPGTGGQTFTVTDFGSPPINETFNINAPQ
jgi:hypothetical protein